MEAAHGQCCRKPQLPNTTSYVRHPGAAMWAQTEKTICLQRLDVSWMWCRLRECDWGMRNASQWQQQGLRETFFPQHYLKIASVQFLLILSRLSPLFSTSCKDACKNCVFSECTFLKIATNNSNEIVDISHLSRANHQFYSIANWCQGEFFPSPFLELLEIRPMRCFTCLWEFHRVEKPAALLSYCSV